MEAHGCPTCERVFDTRRGLGVHHSRVHDERLPNRECDNCGEQFYCEYAKKYCSDACHDEAVSFEGEDNPNYRGGKTTTTCERCDAEFEYYESEKDGLYCPACVQSEDWRDVPIVEGEDHPRWNGGKREYDCAACGETVERYPGNTGEVTTCDEDCRAAWLSEAFTGEGHPNWQGGDVGNYGPGWNRVRREALERDDHECQHCGKTREEIGRNPDVHHIVPVRAFASAEDSERTDAHRLANVVSLCVDCHRRADVGAIPTATLRSTVAAA